MSGSRRAQACRRSTRARPGPGWDSPRAARSCAAVRSPCASGRRPAALSLLPARLAHGIRPYPPAGTPQEPGGGGDRGVWQSDGGALQDGRCGSGHGRSVGDEEHASRGGAGQQPWAPGPPRRVAAEPPCRRELREDEAGVDQAADRVMRVAISRRGWLTGHAEQHVVAAQQDPPRPSASRHPGRGQAPSRAARGVLAERLAQRRAERERAPAEHQEADEHDLRVPRARCRQAAEMQAAGSLPGLPQRVGDPRAGERGRPGDAGRPEPEHCPPRAFDHATRSRRSVHQTCPRGHSVGTGSYAPGDSDSAPHADGHLRATRSRQPFGPSAVFRLLPCEVPVLRQCNS